MILMSLPALEGYVSVSTESLVKQHKYLKRLFWFGLFVLFLWFARHSVSLNGSWWLSLQSHAESGNGWSYQVMKKPYLPGLSAHAGWQQCDRLSHFIETVIGNELQRLEYPVWVKAESGEQFYRALILPADQNWGLYVSEFPDMGGANANTIPCEEWTIYGRFPWMWQLDAWVEKLVARSLSI